MCSIESGLGQKGHLSSEVNFYFSSSFLIVIILPITLKENCSFIFAWMQRSVMKQKINGFLNSQAQVYLSAVCLSAGMRLCEESVICKVASIYSLNSKQVSLWIFTSGQLNFFSFLFFDWNPVIHFLVTIPVCVFLMIDSYFKWFCLFSLLWPNQTYAVCLDFWCLSSVNSCFCFTISWLVQ